MAVVGGEAITMVEVVFPVRDDSHGGGGDGGVMWCVADVEWGRRGCGGAWWPVGCKGADLFVHQLDCKFNYVLHGLWLRCHYTSVNH
nr:hypothetical protein [Tanacetum cinerariifolium]